MAAVQESPSREDRQSNIAPRPRGPAVLVVDDDREMCELAEAGLSQRGYSVTWRMSPEEALALLEQEDFAVLFVDIHMEGMSGLDLCRAALAKRPDLVVVVMTGFGSLEHAIGAMRAGAYDFITKPVPMDALALTLERAVRHRAMSDELRRLRRRVETRELPRVVGSSPVMQRVADLVDRVADSETNVLITGESGTGKELVARAIHERSGRRGPFLAINCAAMPENLLESELFGHVRGAFTDARSARTGLFVEADQGSLFLDEIGEMPMGMQAKILRALQERKVRPLGSSQELQFDARIIAATNRDLDKEVAEKRFREDLFYRINVERIDVPTICARFYDTHLHCQQSHEPVAKRRDKAMARLSGLVVEHVISFERHGNVREVANSMELAVSLARGGGCSLDVLPRM